MNELYQLAIHQAHELLKQKKISSVELTKSTLERIAAAQPQTLEELEAVKGVGPKKLQQYGQAVLDITRQEGEVEA